MHPIIASIAVLLSAGPAFSQADKVSLRTLATARAEFPELWVAASGKATPLTFSNAQPSSPLSADKTSPFRIFKGPLDDSGKPADTSPSVVDLPASASILLLGWLEEGKPVFRAVPDSFATAKHDDWLVINLTKKPLTVQIGESEKSSPIEADSHLAFKCTAPVGEGAAATVSAQQADGNWKPVYSSFLPIYKDQRGLILAVQKGERVSVNYIADPISSKGGGKR